MANEDNRANATDGKRDEPCVPKTDVQIIPPGEVSLIVSGIALGFTLGFALGALFGARNGKG